MIRNPILLASIPIHRFALTAAAMGGAALSQNDTIRRNKRN
jgi:hypothetical protein